MSKSRIKYTGECVTCHKVKPLEARNMCMACYRKERRAVNPDHADARRVIEARSRHKLKDTVINGLGGKCACCGEETRCFLCVDHINNDGKEHRKQFGSNLGVYTDIVRQGLPKDKYRVLCHNCNAAHNLLGYCPHEEEQYIREYADSMGL